MRQPSLSRPALTLVELLVVIAIVAVLIGLLLPAVQVVRASAQATRCRNNLRQIALATLHFHDAQGSFPPARNTVRLDPNAPPIPGGFDELDSLSWLMRILPYIEQKPAYDQFNVDDYYSGQTFAARTQVIDTYLCPARRGREDAVCPTTIGPPITFPCGCSFPGQVIPSGATSDYGGNHGDLSPGSSGLPTDFYWGGRGTGIIISSVFVSLERKFEWVGHLRIADVADGLSSTLLVGEMHVLAGRVNSLPDNGPAYDGSRFFNMSRVGGPGVPIAKGPYDDVFGMGIYAFGSWHKNVCHFAFADGHVVPIRNGISTEALERLCNRADGFVAPES